MAALALTLTSCAGTPGAAAPVPGVSAHSVPSAPTPASPEQEPAVPGVTVSRHAATPPPVVQVAAPTSIAVPAIGLEAPIHAVGVADDGQMQLPEDPAELGWYRFGPEPGAASGTAVLGGHLDSRRYGVGPLARLREVRPDDRIDIVGARGEDLTYIVESVQDLPRTALPVATLFRRDGEHRVVLVTCGGRFLPDAGGYQENLVVTAVPA